MKIIKRIYYKLIGMHPGKMPQVKYWRTKDFVEAKQTTKDGATMMVMEGEDEPMWGIPRGHLLIPTQPDIEAHTIEERIAKYGALPVLKHECKQIFNEALRKENEGVPHETIVREAKQALWNLPLESLKYDLMPSSTMCPAVREIHRAFTKVGTPLALRARDVLTLILQEDDAYRYRVQWMIVWWPLIKRNPIKILLKGLKMVERGEIIGDMKSKIKLLRKGLEIALQDESIKKRFETFFKEINWKKVIITNMDRYHFRGKYFKVDMDVLTY